MRDLIADNRGYYRVSLCSKQAGINMRHHSAAKSPCFWSTSLSVAGVPVLVSAGLV